jgi:hypothetical protein
MKDCPMADRDFGSNQNRMAGTRMKDSVILDIRPVPDYDTIFIRPDDGTIPDADLLSKGHITKNGGIGCDKDLTVPHAIPSHNNIGS